MAEELDAYSLLTEPVETKTEPAPNDLFAPDTTPYTPITEAGTDTVSAGARAAMKRPAVDVLSTVATRLEQFRGNQYHIAHNQVLYALSELGFKNAFADFRGRAGEDLEDAVNSRMARLRVERPEVSTADVSEQNRLRSAVLIDEALSRASSSREEFVEAAAVTGRTMVARALKAAFPEGAPGATTPEGLSRQNEVTAAAHRLQALTPEQWADYATYAARHTGEQPRNAEEEALFSSRVRFATVPAGNPTTTDLQSEIGHALRVLTQNPTAPVGYTDLRRQVQRATNLKKAGVLGGDPFKEGVLVADPEADLGYSPLQFLSTSTLTEIARPVAAGTGAKVTEADAAKVALATGSTVEDARQALQAKTVADAAQAVDFALRRPATTTLPDLTPEASASIEGSIFAPWRGSGHAYRGIVSFLDSVVGAGRQAADAVRDAQKDTMWAELGKVLVTNVTERTDLASQQKDFFQALTTVGKWGLFAQGVTQEYRDQAALGLGGDAAAQAAYINQSFDLNRLWGTGREAAYAEQEARLKRIGEAMASGDPRNLSLLDVGRASVFGAVDGLAQGFIGIINRPESIPLVLAGEKIGDAVLANARGAIGGMVSRAVNAASLKVRLAELGTYRPKFVDDVLAYVNNSIERHVQAGTYDEIAPVLNEAQARAKVLRDAYVDDKLVRADHRDVSAFAGAVARAMPHIEDDLGGMGEELLANVSPTPSTFEWKQWRDLWRSWRGTVPSTITRDINRFLARTSKVDLGGIAARLSDPTTQLDPIVDLTAQLDRAPTPEARNEIANKLIDLKAGVNYEGGMAALLRDVHEMTGLANNPDPAAKTRYRELAGRLADPGRLAEVDAATLRVLGDAVGNRATHPIWDTLAKWLHSKTGERLFSSAAEIGNFNTAVKILESFAAQQAGDLYVGKVMHGLKSMRLERVYDYAIAKTETALSAAILAEPDNLNAHKMYRDTLEQLRTEKRTALTRPLDAPWQFDESKLGRRLITPKEFVNLVKDDPLLFGVAPNAEILEGGPTHQQAASFGLLDLDVKMAKSALDSIKRVKAALGGTAKLPGWLRKAAERGLPLAHLQELVGKRLRLLRGREDSFRLAEAALERGGKVDPQATKAFVDRMLEEIDEAEQTTLPSETAAVYRAFVKSVPEHYWTSAVRLRLTGDTKVPGLQGNYSPVAVLLRVFNHTDPTTFFHEFGHHFLHVVLEDSEVFELQKIFDAEYTPLKTGDRDFDHYMNSFTEWFARRFAQYAQEKVLPRTEVAPLFSRLWERFQRTISKIAAHFRVASLEPPAMAWLDRFFEGKAATTGQPFSPGTQAARERWLRFGRQQEGAAPEFSGQKLIAQGLRAEEVPALLDTTAEEIAALVTIEPDLNKPLGGFEKVAFDWDREEASMAKELRRRTEVRDARASVMLEPSDHAQRMLGELGTTALPVEMRRSLASLERIRSSSAGHSFLDPDFDLATVSAMSFWDQARVLREFRRTTAQKITVHAQRLADLGAALNRMEDADRRALTSALTRGVLVDDAILAKYPSIQRIMPHRGNAADARAANLNAWLKSESAAQAALIEAAHRAGFIDDSTLKGLETVGYRPHLYGMYERPSLVTSPKFREAKRAIAGAGGSAGIAVGKDGTELMFARDLSKWRVRAREADGHVHDELFDTAKAAQQYVRRKFGSETLQNMQRSAAEDAYLIGKTVFGDEVVIADPIGDVGADVLDLLTGRVQKVMKKDKSGKLRWTGRYTAQERASPIGRLEAFAKLNRDLHIHAMLESLQEFGLVLRPEEFHATLSARKGGVADFSSQYIELPNSAQSFGNLRGAFVHRRVLSELNSIHHSYDQLRTWVEALADVYIRHGLSPPTEVLGEAPGRLASLDRSWGLAVKTTQIAMNAAAVFSNMTSNLLFGLLAGGPGVFGVRNLDGWATAINDVMGEVPREFLDSVPGAGRRKTMRSAKYVGKTDAWDAAVRHGVIDGALFDRIDNRDLRDGLLRVTGLVGPTAKGLKGRLSKLQTLLDEKARAAVDGKPAAHIAQIELEIAAIEEALRADERGMLRRMVDWAGGLIGLTYRNSFGLPANRVTAFLRDFYGRLDDMFKYATFLHLRKSMPDDRAAWHVKTFMQNYANVPTAISQLGRSPLGALVPSFGYEMGRIFVNSMRHKPLRAMGLMGSIYALNAVSAATAGVPFERVDELQKSAGYKDWFSRFVNSANTIQVYDPRTKDLIGSYGLGSSFIPIYGFLDSQGAVANLVDEVVPDEARGGLLAPVAAALSGAGNFVGGRPYLNALAGLAFNRDPATGQPLVSEDPLKVSWWDRARAAWHVVGKGFIPPLAPGGRQFANIWESYDTPINPDTGKPMGGMTPAAAWTRSLTNIQLKGTASYRVAQLLDAAGIGSGKPEPGVVANDATILKALMWEVRGVAGGSAQTETPLFGDDHAERQLWGRWASETDPARKTEAEKALRAQLAKSREIYVRGRRVTVGRDEHEIFLAMKAAQERGSDTQFAKLTPEQQALVITGMDAVGDVSTVSELVRLAKFNADGTRLNLETNPYAVQAAQRVILDWVKEGRARQPVLDYLDYLQRIERRAIGASRRQQIIHSARMRARGIKE